ncbi:MAG: hypothetical protein H7289_07815 [Mucilaginibacter sp.]|nr:hypothetical protein [Mucilaginibacter sp.]
MPKSTKRFTISDDRLNSHGFRMLTDGADISDFIANPIMYWMHVYPTGGKPDELLPIGFWEDIEQKDGKITAVPNFDDGDTFAMKIYGKVEHGTLRACSAGAEPKPNGLSVNPADMLPGQTLPTFTSWWLREASICDRGSNAGAVALRVNGKMVQLSDDASEVINSLLKNQKLDMKLTQLTAGGLTAMLAALKLNAETATEQEVTEEVGKLVTLTANQASAIHTLTTEKSDLEGKVTEVQNKLDAQVKLSNQTKIETLVNGAADARKITKEEAPLYVTLAHNHKDGFDAGFKQVEDLLEKKVGVPSVQDALKNGGESKDELSGLVKLSYDELFSNGGLTKLKALSPIHFEEKMAEKFPNRKAK